MEILFENDDCLVINKPAGLMVHPDGKSTEPTLVDWINKTYPSMRGVGEPLRIDGHLIDRPGIVHRLDRDTSGALLLAKTPEAFQFLKSQFQERRVHKEYHAFVWGHFKESPLQVDAPIGRNKNDFRKWHAGRGVRGETREAVTDLIAAAQFEAAGEKFSFIRAFPLTGRTHQIRVHLKYIQRPIVCDALYGQSYPPALGFERLALHARKVQFQGLQGEDISVEAPYPEDFTAALAKYVKP